MEPATSAGYLFGANTGTHAHSMCSFTGIEDLKDRTLERTEVHDLSQMFWKSELNWVSTRQ